MNLKIYQLSKPISLKKMKSLFRKQTSINLFHIHKLSDNIFHIVFQINDTYINSFYCQKSEYFILELDNGHHSIVDALSLNEFHISENVAESFHHLLEYPVRNDKLNFSNMELDYLSMKVLPTIFQSLQK